MKHWKSAALALFLAAWFLSRAWRGLFVYFQGDDMMNTYQAWLLPWWKVLAANLTPFTTVYRPFGSLYYKAAYSVFGFHPLGFRVVTYSFMLLNIALMYRLARLITGSTAVAALTALLGSYHPRLMDLFLNNGTVYDVLACTFVLLALCSYVRAKPVWFLVSFVVALNSKEMAAAVPLILLVYDWVWRRKLGSMALWISFAATAIAFKVKTAAPSFANVPDYGVHVNLHQFLSTARPLTAELFYLPGGAFNTFDTVLVFTAIWGIALAFRSKPLLFAAAFATFSPLPVNFITYRGFFVMYLPLVGWAMYFAVAIVQGRDWVVQQIWKRPALSADGWEPERISLFLFTTLALFLVQSGDAVRSFDQVDRRAENLARAFEQFAPHFSPGGRILLLHAPYPSNVYDPLFIARLAYRDLAIEVDREERRPGETYALILDYQDGHYVPN